MGFVAWCINQLGRDKELAMPNEYWLGHLKGQPFQKGDSHPAESEHLCRVTGEHPWLPPPIIDCKTSSTCWPLMSEISPFSVRACLL